MVDKKVFVLRIGDYRPDLCEFTIPTIKVYASKIGAEYIEITKRSSEAWPVTYEKLQVYDLGKDSDWNLMIDADVMIRPDAPDATQFLPPDAVASAFAFDADRMFVSDRFFERDGRNIGIVSNFVVTTRLTHDIWEPLYSTGMMFEEARMYSKREFILDEYTLSRNLAKYGLKHVGILPMPALEEMIVHLGSEELDVDTRAASAARARELYGQWKTQYPEAGL